MSSSLETAPSCAAAIPGGRPREAERNQESVSLSRSKRRKLRERRVAVRHALCHTSKLKEQLGEAGILSQSGQPFTSAVDEQHCLTPVGLRLAHLEHMTTKILSIVLDYPSMPQCANPLNPAAEEFIMPVSSQKSMEALLDYLTDKPLSKLQQTCHVPPRREHALREPLNADRLPDAPASTGYYRSCDALDGFAPIACEPVLSENVRTPS